MKIPALFAASMIAIMATGESEGYVLVTDQHVDLQLVYASGTLSGRVSPDTGFLEPGNALLFDGPDGSTAVERAPDSQWDFLGMGPGQTVYYWPQTFEPDRAYLGFASDKDTIPTGTFRSYFETDPRVAASAPWNKITLLDVRFQPAPGEVPGPAFFSLWQNDFDGNATVWMSSFTNGIDPTDAAWLLAGGHEHFNWGFTKRGHYQIEFKFSGLLSNGDFIESVPQTFHFGVEFTPSAIPEPRLWLLLTAGAVALGSRRTRARGILFPDQPTSNR